MDEEKRLSYFCLGLGIGVAFGILFAPKAGDETRQFLRSKADEGKDLLRSKADESKEYVSRKTTELKDSATDLVDRSKYVIQRQKEQLAAAVDAGRQAYKEALTTDTPSGSGTSL